MKIDWEKIPQDVKQDNNQRISVTPLGGIHRQFHRHDIVNG